MKLKRTSHFIGFKLDSEAFVDLYVRLQQFLHENNLRECIEIQNILSLHTTLYYFESDIPVKDLAGIEDFISAFRKKKKNAISIKGFEYFRSEGKENLFYLKPENDSFSVLKQQLVTRFQRGTVANNQHAFIPHVTLFKIIDLNTYQKYRPHFEKIVHQCLEEIGSMDVCEDLHFFAVYSQAKPEIQISL